MSAPLSTRALLADKANLTKARAAQKKPRSAAQRAASRANLYAARATKTMPSAAQLAERKAWAAKGRAAWLAGESVWIARGRLAWKSHKAHTRVGGHHGHTLVASPLKRLPIGTRLVRVVLKRPYSLPTLKYKPHKFFAEITSMSNASMASNTSWRRARQHQFRTRLHPRRARRQNLGHWRRTRGRVHPY